MPCLKCGQNDLTVSQPLSDEEQVGELQEIHHFVMCNRCGYVMMSNITDELVSTDDIRNEDIIQLSFLKLFADAGQKPNAYGHTQTEKPTRIKEEWIPDATSVLGNENEVVVQYSVIEHVDNSVTTPPTKIYPHVDKPEPALNIFGKLDRFVTKTFASFKSLFKKAS